MLAQQEEPGGRFTDRDIELQSMRLTNILQNPKMLNNLAYMLAQQEESLVEDYRRVILSTNK